MNEMQQKAMEEAESAEPINYVVETEEGLMENVWADKVEIQDGILCFYQEQPDQVIHRKVPGGFLKLRQVDDYVILPRQRLMVTSYAPGTWRKLFIAGDDDHVELAARYGLMDPREMEEAEQF